MITHVAIIHNGKTYSLPKPNRHHHLIHQIYLETGHAGFFVQQGFLDDQGNYLNRLDALQHVRACKQILTDHPIWDDWLYSENLW